MISDEVSFILRREEGNDRRVRLTIPRRKSNLAPQPPPLRLREEDLHGIDSWLSREPVGTGLGRRTALRNENEGERSTRGNKAKRRKEQTNSSTLLDFITEKKLLSNVTLFQDESEPQEMSASMKEEGRERSKTK